MGRIHHLSVSLVHAIVVVVGRLLVGAAIEAGTVWLHDFILLASGVGTAPTV